MKKKSVIDKIEAEDGDKANSLIDNPNDVAYHFKDIYHKIFNTNHESSINKLKKILGNERGNLGKINEKEHHKITKDITYNEVKIGVKELRLSASGGADGITGRLMKLVFSFVPILIHNSVNEIVKGTNKPIDIAERFLIFIKKSQIQTKNI